MKKIHSQFNTLKDIQLSKEERALMQSNLDAYKELKPLSAERIENFSRLPKVKPSSFTLFQNFTSMPLIASLLIALSVGGGTAFAAEGAVPGDVLYPIKTEITENVRGAVAFNAEAQAEFETWRAERRLDEASHLAARAALTEEKRDRLEENFTAHADRAEERIARIAENDPTLAAELSTRFEASLLAHEAILASFDATTSSSVAMRARDKAAVFALARQNADAAFAQNDTASTATMGIAMRAEVAPSAKTVAPAPAVSVDFEVAAKRMYEAAKKSLNETQELYKRVHGKLTEEQIVRIDAFFKEKITLYEESEAQYENHMYSEAYLGFQRVVASMKSLTVFLKSDSQGSTDMPPIRIVPIIDPIPLPPVMIDPVEIEYEGEGYVDPVRPIPIDVEIETESSLRLDI